jgi:hypothetical protein
MGALRAPLHHGGRRAFGFHAGIALDESPHVFIAPCQLKANNGILIIDDFGRQMITPRELLNRWIVPLDRRVDYLTLASGMKFQVPFELMVVFSTNLDPRELADEAFLRRIQTKVLVEDVTAEVFDEIFQRVAQAHNARRARRRAVSARALPERIGRTICGHAIPSIFTGW